MVVLTVGKSYIDIDGYASAIAYKELLKMQGIDAKFVSNAKLNYSITKSLLSTPYGIDKYEIQDTDKFIVLDLSNKEYFPEFVKEDSVIEIIDHHPGFEEYWKERLEDKSIIEEIGSVATIIVEKYEKANLLDRMNKDVARLLMAAILDNTLNFTATISNERDLLAYSKLDRIVSDYNYKEKYFLEVQESIEKNLEEAIKNDVKTQSISEYLPKVFGQLTVWDAKGIFDKIGILKYIMNRYNSDWIMNVISLKDNMSYILYSNNDVKTKLEEILDCYSDSEVLILKPAMLRKEIMKKAITKEKEK